MFKKIKKLFKVVDGEFWKWKTRPFNKLDFAIDLLGTYEQNFSDLEYYRDYDKQKELMLRRFSVFDKEIEEKLFEMWHDWRLYQYYFNLKDKRCTK